MLRRKRLAELNEQQAALDEVVAEGLRRFDTRWLAARATCPKAFGDGRPFEPDAVGAGLRRSFEEVLRNTSYNVDIDGLGIFWLLSLMGELESKEPSLETAAMVAELRKAMLERGAFESERAVSAFALYMTEYWESTGALKAFIASMDDLSSEQFEEPVPNSALRSEEHSSNVGMVSPDGRWVWTGSEWAAKEQSPASWFSRVPRPVKRIGGILAVGLAGLTFAYAQGQNESNSAPKIGECARVVGDDEIESVPCDDTLATLRVTSRHDSITDGEVACSADPTATSYYSFEERSRGTSLVSFVLCFEDI